VAGLELPPPARPPAFCPHCTAEVEFPAGPPEPGQLGFCPECGEPCGVRDNGTLRTITATEFRRLGEQLAGELRQHGLTAEDFDLVAEQHRLE